MFPILKAVSTTAMGLHAGACLYINVVEHKARMQLDTRACHKQWKESFDLSKRHQRTLALVAGVSTAGVYYCKPSTSLTFLLGGVSVFLTFPYTLFVLRPAAIDPIYDDYDKIVDRNSEEFVRETVDKWNCYHTIRTGISVAVFVGFVAQILNETPFF